MEGALDGAWEVAESEGCEKIMIFDCDETYLATGFAMEG